LQEFYVRLLGVLRRRQEVRQGRWQLLECAPAWEGNWTSDCFVAYAWHGSHGERLLVAVNYAPNQSQCYVRLPFADLADDQWKLENLLGDEAYDRDGHDLRTRGLYLDVAPWKALVSSVTKESKASRPGSRRRGAPSPRRLASGLLVTSVAMPIRLVSKAGDRAATAVRDFLQLQSASGILLMLAA